MMEAARRASGAAAAAWRTGPAWQAMAEAFADCPDDDPEPVAARLAALFADDGWPAALIAPLIAALSEAPLADPPFRVTRDALRVAASLFHCRAGTLTATVTSAAGMRMLPPPRSVVFAGRVSVTRTVRNGGAVLLRWQLAGGNCMPVAPLRLEDGAVHRLDGRCDAVLLADARSDVVTLTASIAAGAAPLLREHDLASGACLRLAFADDRPSRSEMLLALLRTAGRDDAADCFEAATHDTVHALRWAAMREWLALDARAALPRLATMAANDPDLEVRAAAAWTLPRVEARCRG